ncbi:MAG: hypothetical protein EOM20_20310 [Spartobacteria bacterium]|nr:hypothetical protein [Spartobacteria bacterium]
MTINENILLEALEENRENIKAHVRQVILDGITRQFQWELPDVIKKEVAAFMAEEIAPEIRKQLIEDKEAIVDAAAQAVQGIAVEVGKSLQKTASESLTSSYKSRDIVKALFGY